MQTLQYHSPKNTSSSGSSRQSWWYHLLHLSQATQSSSSSTYFKPSPIPIRRFSSVPLQIEQYSSGSEDSGEGTDVVGSGAISSSEESSLSTECFSSANYPDLYPGRCLEICFVRVLPRCCFLRNLCFCAKMILVFCFSRTESNALRISSMQGDTSSPSFMRRRFIPSKPSLYRITASADPSFITSIPIASVLCTIVKRRLWIDSLWLDVRPPEIFSTNSGELYPKSVKSSCIS